MRELEALELSALTISEALAHYQNLYQEKDIARDCVRLSASAFLSLKMYEYTQETINPIQTGLKSLATGSLGTISPHHFRSTGTLSKSLPRKSTASDFKPV
jgi:hypothetical protein